MGHCRALGQWRSFASLVAGLPPFEVCRYMLASLQLVSTGGGSGGDPRDPPSPLTHPPSPQANDYVVELAQDPGLEQALDTLRLQLLTHERAQDRIRAFQPPSACP